MRSGVLARSGADERPPTRPDERPSPPAATSSLQRLHVLVDEHHDFIWRTLRRFGVPPADTDDATQRVFLVLARKLAAVRPGSERRFLVQTALRVAADARRTVRRRREQPQGLDGVDPPSPAADAFDLLAERQARERLDRILDRMPLDLRAVFVLFELEEMTMADIATTTGLRPGTVASRLRRARTMFSEFVSAASNEAPARGGTP